MDEVGSAGHQNDALVMQRTRVQDQGSLERENQSKYRGSARIGLEHLDFSKSEPDVPDRSNVKGKVASSKIAGIT